MAFKLHLLKIFFTSIFLGTSLLALGCGKASSNQTPLSIHLESTVPIPQQADWVDYGIIFKPGEKGEWDYYLWGGFAFSVIKKDSTYFLYYQGSSDYRTEYDETVMWRSIGVATSQDGIHFTKYEGNPVLTWFPSQNPEEGAVSSGVTLGEQGEIVLYYGANTEESPITVNADVRVASSQDGFNFTDLGLVLSHDDSSVWGSGDELFPVNAIYNAGKWVVYYIPNGTPEDGLLGVAQGDQFNSLNQTSAVLADGNTIPVWGTSGHVKLDANTYALTLNHVLENRAEVRLVTMQAPNFVSEPVVEYQLEAGNQVVLLLDDESEIWYMYYRTPEDGYGVKLAHVKNGTTATPTPTPTETPTPTATPTPPSQPALIKSKIYFPFVVNK